MKRIRTVILNPNLLDLVKRLYITLKLGNYVSFIADI